MTCECKTRENGRPVMPLTRKNISDTLFMGELRPVQKETR